MRVIVAILLTASVLPAWAGNAADDQPARVTVTQLVEQPNAFSGKKVVVEGYWVTGFEWSYLSAQADSSQALPIWLQRWMMPGNESRIDVQAIASAVKKADQAAVSPQTNTSSSRQYWIKCVGRFEHVTVRRFTPQDPGVGFGHLGVYPSQLRIEQIIEIRVVPLPKDFIPNLPY